MNAALDSFVAGLLPGSDIWPSGLEIVFDVELPTATIEMRQAWQEISTWILPPTTERVELQQVLQRYEASDSATFAQGMLMAYGCYYSHPRILAVVEQRCGYSARPPQPLGHPVVYRAEVHPISALSDVRWRLDGTAQAEQIQQIQRSQPAHIWTEEEISTWPTL